MIKCDATAVACWCIHLSDGMTRALLRIEIKLGRLGKRSKVDETYFFKIP